MRHLLLRLFLSGHRDEDMGRRLTSFHLDSLMIGSISLPCTTVTGIVDVKPGTSGIWKRFTSRVKGRACASPHVKNSDVAIAEPELKTL